MGETTTRTSSRSRSLPPRLRLDLIRLRRLAGLGGGAFLERGFPAQFHAAFVVDTDALHPDHLADLGDVFGAVHAEIGQLGNVNQAILTREHFDECTEFFDRNDATVIGLADFDFAGHAADDFLRAGHAFGAGRVNVNGTVVLDINLSAGLGDDALDGFATRSDERADLLRINFDR